MIEIEKKFQPTQEQLEKILDGAFFLGEKINQDTYYDFPDYRLFKTGDRIRRRGDIFEYKRYSTYEKKGILNIADEITDEEEIKTILGFVEYEKSLASLVGEQFIEVASYFTKRKKYKKEQFYIDIDEMSYGISVVEIEVLVDDSSKISDVEIDFKNFIDTYNLEEKKLDGKTIMYLKKVKPDLYNEIFRQK